MTCSKDSLRSKWETPINISNNRPHYVIACFPVKHKLNVYKSFLACISKRKSTIRTVMRRAVTSPDRCRGKRGANGGVGSWKFLAKEKKRI